MRKIFLCLLLAGCAGSHSSNKISLATLNVADAALKSGNPTLALQVAHNVLISNPENRSAKLHEADALYALDRKGEARLIYQQLYSSRPTTAAAAGLAKCVLRQNPKLAASLLHLAINNSPNNISFLTDLGVAEDFLGNHYAAQVTYMNVLNLDPTQVPAQADLALSLALSGHLDHAVRLLRPLAMAQESTPRLRQDYGAILALAGHADQGAIILAADLPPAEAHQAAWTYKAFALSSMPKTD
jgi:Flp pilus assembly protein TadD